MQSVQKAKVCVFNALTIFSSTHPTHRLGMKVLPPKRTGLM